MVKIGELYFSVISFLSNLIYFSLCIQKRQSAHDSIGFPRLLEVSLTHRPKQMVKNALSLTSLKGLALAPAFLEQLTESGVS